MLYWAAFLDVARAMLAERENPGMIVAKATWKNSIDFHIAADRIGGADVVELNPWGRLVRALRDGDVIALGRFMGASGVDPIPAREWQGNALHLCESEGGFVCAAALTFDIEAGPHWRALVFDRASVLRTFPPRPSDPLFAATEPVAAIDATAQITEPPPSNTAGDSLRTRLTLARDFIGPVGEGEQIYLSFVWRYLAKHGHSPGRRIKEQIAERLRAEYGRRINQGGTCPAALRQALEERISAE